MSSSGVAWAAVAPLIVLGLGWVIFCLIMVTRAPAVRWLPRWGWALVVVLSVPLGGVVFLLAGRTDQ